MSFFKQMLSKIGIGSATVETTFYNDTFIPGEPIKGIVKITGGTVPQEIDTIYLIIKSTYEDKIDMEVKEDEEGKTVKISRVAEIISLELSQPFTLAPEEIRSFDLDFILPIDTPGHHGKDHHLGGDGSEYKNGHGPRRPGRYRGFFTSPGRPCN